MKQKTETTCTDLSNETTIPTAVINFDEYDPRTIDVWENFISMNGEKERATRIILDADSPFLIDSGEGAAAPSRSPAPPRQRRIRNEIN